jgi:flagellar hook-associated protein 3 FlgL
VSPRKLHMRIATLNASSNAFDGIAARQAEQNRIQGQLSTGLRVNSPGDDPVAASQAELARSRLVRIDQDNRAAGLATSVLSMADNALAEGTNLLQTFRETLVAAGSGTYSAGERNILAQQLRASRDAFLNLANATDGAGGFVFGGQGSVSNPMAIAGGASYIPAAGQQRVGEGGRFSTTIDGRSTFVTLPQGNGVFTAESNAANTGAGWIDPGVVVNPGDITGQAYQIAVTAGGPGALQYSVVNVTTGLPLASQQNRPFVSGQAIDFDGQRVTLSGTPAAGDTFEIRPSTNQSVFETLDQAIALLEDPVKAAQYPEKLQRLQSSVDRALDRMILTRTTIGEEMRAVDSATRANEQLNLNTEQRRSDLQDLDFAKAISESQNNQAALQAALQSYASVAKMSLMEMIR